MIDFLVVIGFLLFFVLVLWTFCWVFHVIITIAKSRKFTLASFDEFLEKMTEYEWKYVQGYLMANKSITTDINLGIIMFSGVGYVLDPISFLRAFKAKREIIRTFEELTGRW